MILPVLIAAAQLSVAAPTRFHITNTTVTNIDASAMGQGVQAVTIAVSAYVTVTLSDSAGGKVAHVVIDSSTFDGGLAAGALPPEMTADPRGAFFHLFVVNGQIKSPFVPSPPSVQASQIAPGVQLLLTSLRMAKTGEHWSDSTHSDTTANQMSANGSRVIDWTTTAAPDGGMSYQGNLAATTSVGGASMQMEMKLTGTSSLSGVPGQLARQATSKASGHATMNLMGSALPMEVTTEVTVSPVM